MLQHHYFCNCAGLLLWVIEFWHDIWDVVPWMSVQALFESLLVQIVTDESHAAPQNKQRIQCADLNVLLRFLSVDKK